MRKQILTVIALFTLASAVTTTSQAALIKGTNKADVLIGDGPMTTG